MIITIALTISTPKTEKDLPTIRLGTRTPAMQQAIIEKLYLVKRFRDQGSGLCYLFSSLKIYNQPTYSSIISAPLLLRSYQNGKSINKTNDE